MWENELHISWCGNKKGHVIFFLHGWGMNSDIFSDILPFFSDYCIGLIDLYRSCFHVSLLYNIDTFSDYLVKTLNHLSPAPYLLMGWSLGGVVVMNMACRMRDKIKGIISVASPPCFMANEREQGLTLTDIENFEILLKNNKMKLAKRFLYLSFFKKNGMIEDKKRLQYWAERFILMDNTLLFWGLQWLKETDLSCDVMNITCPWLSLYGESDILVSKRWIDLDVFPSQIHKIIMKESGHMPFLTQRQDFTEIVTLFLHAEVL